MPVLPNKIELFVFGSSINRTATSNKLINAYEYMSKTSFSSSGEDFVKYGFPTTMDTLNSKLPARMFFTEHGRFFLQKPLDTKEIMRYGECTGKFCIFGTFILFILDMPGG